MPQIKIEHAPPNKVLINGKDCTELHDFICDFAEKADLNMHEMCCLLIDISSTQVASMDFEYKDTDGLQFLTQMLGHCYTNALAHFASKAMIAMHKGEISPHGAH